MSNKNIFFYRDKCKICNQIYLILKNNNFTNYFNFVNVDTTQTKIKIREVPALLIYQLKQIYYGQEIFNFINGLIQQRRQQQIRQEQQLYYVQQQTQNNPHYVLQQNIKQNQQQTIQNKIQQQNQQVQRINSKSKILGFNENEMKGFSDSYIFSDPNINIAPQHSFVGKNDTIKIYTGSADTKISYQDTMKTIKKLNEIRKQETEELKKTQDYDRNDKTTKDKIKKINEGLEECVQKYLKLNL